MLALDAHRAAPHFTVWRQAAGEHIVPGSQVNTIAERLLHHSDKKSDRIAPAAGGVGPDTRGD